MSQTNPTFFLAGSQPWLKAMYLWASLLRGRRKIWTRLGRKARDWEGLPQARSGSRGFTAALPTGDRTGSLVAAPCMLFTPLLPMWRRIEVPPAARCVLTMLPSTKSPPQNGFLEDTPIPVSSPTRVPPGSHMPVEIRVLWWKKPPTARPRRVVQKKALFQNEVTDEPDTTLARRRESVTASNLRRCASARRQNPTLTRHGRVAQRAHALCGANRPRPKMAGRPTCEAFAKTCLAAVDFFPQRSHLLSMECEKYKPRFIKRVGKRKRVW